MLTLISLAEVAPSSTSMLNVTAWSTDSNLYWPLGYVCVEKKPSDTPSDSLLTSITPVNVFFGVGDDCAQAAISRHYMSMDVNESTVN
jgi:hypothetical protein